MHLVAVLDAVWTVQARIRGVADEAQWIMQDACASLGMSLGDVAPEVRERADALSRAQLADKVKELAANLREIAEKLEGGAACS